MGSRRMTIKADDEDTAITKGITKCKRPGNRNFSGDCIEINEGPRKGDTKIMFGKRFRHDGHFWALDEVCDKLATDYVVRGSK